MGVHVMQHAMHAKTKPAQVSQDKAKEILRHGEVHGKSLSKKQKGFFGARAGGTPVKRG